MNYGKGQPWLADQWIKANGREFFSFREDRRYREDEHVGRTEQLDLRELFLIDRFRLMDHVDHGFNNSISPAVVTNNTKIVEKPVDTPTTFIEPNREFEVEDRFKIPRYFDNDEATKNELRNMLCRSFRWSR